MKTGVTSSGPNSNILPGPGQEGRSYKQDSQIAGQADENDAIFFTILIEVSFNIDSSPQIRHKLCLNLLNYGYGCLN